MSITHIIVGWGQRDPWDLLALAYLRKCEVQVESESLYQRGISECNNIEHTLLASASILRHAPIPFPP